MNSVIVDPDIATAAPPPARPPVLRLWLSICRRDALLRSALPFRTRIAMTDDPRAAAAVRPL
jgi:hypothetical protein